MTANNKSERTGKHRSQLTLGKYTVSNWVIDSQQRLQTTDLLYLQTNLSGRLRSQFLSQCHILSNLYSWNSYNSRIPRDVNTAPFQVHFRLDQAVPLPTKYTSGYISLSTSAQAVMLRIREVPNMKCRRRHSWYPTAPAYKLRLCLVTGYCLF